MRAEFDQRFEDGISSRVEEFLLGVATREQGCSRMRFLRGRRIRMSHGESPIITRACRRAFALAVSMMSGAGLVASTSRAVVAASTRSRASSRSRYRSNIPRETSLRRQFVAPRMEVDQELVRALERLDLVEHLLEPSFFCGAQCVADLLVSTSPIRAGTIWSPPIPMHRWNSPQWQHECPLSRNALYHASACW